MLAQKGVSCDVIKLARLNDIALPMVMTSLQKTKKLFVAEEACSAGCVGEHILRLCMENGAKLDCAQLMNLGDGIVCHGTVEQLRAEYGIDSNGICQSVQSMLNDFEKRNEEVQ